MSKQKLSNNMKKVLCGITLYPAESNKMLAKRLYVNTSTISTSRQRLNERELITKKYIPEFFNLDMSMVMVASGKFRYQFPADVRETIIGFVSHPATPFFITFDDRSWLVMGLVPPGQNELLREPKSIPDSKFLYEMTFDVSKNMFESEKTNVWRYFEYGHLLCKTLNIDISSRRNNQDSLWSLEELKKNESIILQSLINDSQPSDFQRSQVVGISHPTITKIRKSLIKRGVVKSIIKPNLLAFGFSIFAWINIKLEGKDIDNKLMTTLGSDPNNILCINDTDNIFILSVYLSMKDLLSGQQRINEFMSRAMISYEDITFNYFSLENPRFALMLTPESTNRIFTRREDIEEKGIKSEDQEQQLSDILSKFYTSEELSALISEIKDNLGLDPSEESSPNMVSSMILEILIEPKYLSSLQRNDRTALQAKLIEKLNSLRASFDTQTESGSQGKKRSVLIVEDSKTMMGLLKDIVSEANFNVVGSVDNGQGAFERYKSLCEKDNKPDVVLMDIFIKGLNGVEATKMIMEYDPSACIVVLTSSLDSKIKTKLTSMGVDEYLIKPVTKTQLISSLEQSLAKRKGMMI